MKKRSLGLFILIFSLVLGSLLGGCKKASTPNGKIKGQTYWHQFSDTTIIDTLSYTYDQQGRVILIQHVNGSEAYSYSNNSFIYTPVSGPNITGILNNKGLVSSTSDGFIYSYDENGYLLTRSLPTLTDNYTIRGGNIVADSQILNGHSSIQQYLYLDQTDYRDFGRAMYGRANRNLVSSDSILGITKNTAIYTFDNQGRVASETFSGRGVILISKYSYFN